ncbi:MAG: hypothetical protein IKJ40_03185, partial [Bacteroidales bacterium]|nr:hypothetical protein [Bacteroidales bacterium]
RTDKGLSDGKDGIRKSFKFGISELPSWFLEGWRFPKYQTTALPTTAGLVFFSIGRRIMAAG